MSHPESDWSARLSAYLDGDVTRDEARLVESHLATCPECTTLLGELRRVVTRLRENDAAGAALSSSGRLDMLWRAVERQLHPASVTPVDAPGRAGAGIIDARWPARMLAAGVLLAIGLGGGFWIGSHGCGVFGGGVRWAHVAPCAVDVRGNAVARAMVDSIGSAERVRSAAVLDSLIEDARRAQRRTPADSALSKYIRALEEVRERVR